MENTLYALDLTGYAINRPTVEPAMSEASEEENPLIDMAGSLKKNRDALAGKLPNRSLGPLGIVQAPSDLYASFVPHYFIKPQWYKPNENLKDASLSDFTSFMEEFRNETPGQNEALWQKVLNDPLIKSCMQNFWRVNNEMELRGWFTEVLGSIRHLQGEQGYLDKSAGTVFGLGGASAYTDPADGEAVYYAAFLSEVDEVFFRNNVPFAGVEFKNAPLSENKLWFKVGRSALAQTLACLGGNPNSILALFLCNYGFRLIWRKVVGMNIVDGREVKIYQNFTFPPLDPETQAPHLRYCYSTDLNALDDGFDGRQDLLRVLLEFVLSSFVKEETEYPLRALSKSFNEYVFGSLRRDGAVDYLRGFSKSQ
jgi:hypothetical protein